MEERLQYLSGKIKVKPKIDLFLFHLSEIFKLENLCYCMLYLD